MACVREPAEGVHQRSKKLLLACGSALLCVLGFELALRVAGYDPFGDLLDGRELILRESGDPELGYELTPNSEGFAWGAEVKVNSFGFRDREYEVDKPPGTHRIAVIGDSITFGNFLPLEATFPERLEQAFRRHRMRVEVLNLGVGGYDLLQEVAFLRRVGLQFDPDEVIVGYCMNDVGVVSANRRYVRRARSYGAPLYRLRILQFVRSRLDVLEAKRAWLASGSGGEEESRDAAGSPDFVGDARLRERMREIEAQVSSHPDHHRVLSWYASPRRIGKLRAGFQRLKTLSDEHGFGVSVLIVPFVGEDMAAYRVAYDIVALEARRNGFDVIEALQEFVDAGAARVELEPLPTHPNELGHRLIAEKLFGFYLERSQERFRPRAPAASG